MSGDDADASGRHASEVFRFELSQAELQDTPSRRHGISAADEAEQRAYCAELIAETAILLELPMVVAAHAQTLMQRLYHRFSLKELDIRDAAIGVLFLSAKVEDHDRRMRYLIATYQRVLQRRANHVSESKDLPHVEFGSTFYTSVRVCGVLSTSVVEVHLCPHRRRLLSWSARFWLLWAF